MVAEAMTEDPSLSLSAAVKRIGPRIGPRVGKDAPCVISRPPARRHRAVTTQCGDKP